MSNPQVIHEKIVTLHHYALRLNWFQRLFFPSKLLQELNNYPTESFDTKRAFNIYAAASQSRGFLNWLGTLFLSELKRFTQDPFTQKIIHLYPLTVEAFEPYISKEIAPQTLSAVDEIQGNPSNEVPAALQPNTSDHLPGTNDEIVESPLTKTGSFSVDPNEAPQAPIDQRRNPSIEVFLDPTSPLNDHVQPQEPQSRITTPPVAAAPQPATHIEPAPAMTPSTESSPEQPNTANEPISVQVVAIPAAAKAQPVPVTKATLDSHLAELRNLITKLCETKVDSHDKTPIAGVIKNHHREGFFSKYELYRNEYQKVYGQIEKEITALEDLLADQGPEHQQDKTQFEQMKIQLQKAVAPVKDKLAEQAPSAAALSM